MLRHQTLDACLKELKRHPALRLLIDIEREEKVPKPHNMSRFLETLGEEDQLVKLHLLVDVKHEVVIAYRITNTKAGDNELIGDLVAQGQQNLPADRIKTLAYDIDDGQVYGSRRFHAHVGAVLIVHLGLATVLAQAERYEGFFGKMRLSPIAAELRKLLEKPPAAEEKAAR